MHPARAMLTILLGCAALFLAIPSAADPCPSNKVCIRFVGCDSTTSASRGMSEFFSGGVSAETSYDWYVRECRAMTQLPYFSSPIEGTVSAGEEFVVVGLAPGTPLTIHARAHVVAHAYWTGAYTPLSHANGWFEEASAGRVEAIAAAGYADPDVSIDTFLTLDFPNLAGAPFRLSMGAVSESREGGSMATVTLSFEDLPAGAQVYSCHVGPPVPARAATWGGLKLRYR